VRLGNPKIWRKAHIASAKVFNPEYSRFEKALIKTLPLFLVSNRKEHESYLGVKESPTRLLAHEPRQQASLGDEPGSRRE